ncbi:MAG: HlyD family efflux transporter periplasmic adaptor subunit, partial [Clostridia bacterium]|nr:HlyD family efflux transporter periplasmic adaptor subunit [Clostridia bacterium]
VNYIEKLKKFQVDFGEADLTGEDDNAVRIMTIHKSKGLEFPVVILSGATKGFNKSDYSGESRIGRGNAMRRAGQLLQADGVITSVYVKTGDEVKAGDRLFSWLSGERTEHADPVLTSSVDGVLAEIKVSQGQSVTQDAAVATLWPLENMVIEADLSEQDIDLVKLCDTVEVNFDALENRVFRGRVESIGRISTTTGQDATYTVRILPESTEGLRFGMHCTVKLP